MKRINRWLSILLVFCMALAAIPNEAGAFFNSTPYAVEGGNIYFNATSGEITGADYSITAANIPSEINGKPVTGITSAAFSYLSDLEQVTIPGSITTIKDSAFSHCSALTSVTILDGVTSIADAAFTFCSNLTELSIPDTVTSIGTSAFASCSKLAEVALPPHITSISNFAFDQCTSLTEIIIPDGVTSIGNYAFRNCASATLLTLPDTLTTIGNYAFASCSNLTKIDIPYGVTSIGISGFDSCKKLVEITIPDTVTSIGNSAFQRCYVLTDVDLPSGIIQIGDFTFQYCMKLTEFNVPGNVVSIGESAFDCCTGLTNVTIPDSVTTIGNLAFSYCSELTHVNIPNGVSSIGESAFLGCSSLTSVVVPGSVTSIGADAFTTYGEITIYGESDTYAEQYAAENNIPFISASIVSLSGYVQTKDGIGVSDVVVTLFDRTSGSVQSKLLTNSQGFWSIPQAFVDHTYRISYFHPDYKTEGLDQIYTIGDRPVVVPTVIISKATYRTSGASAVDKLTQPEVSGAMAQSTLLDLGNLYTVAPSITVPYQSGQVRDDIILAGLDRMNNMRLLAGLPAVTLNSTYAQYCQDGALINAINKQLSHGPTKPEGMDENLYQSGYTGTSSSNLALHYSRRAAGGPLAYSVDLYMDDSDSRNVSALGHRRWILNPTMSQTAFGCVENGSSVYCSLYALDRNGPEQNYDFIGWPSSGNFPCEIFDKHCAWSVSLNSTYYATPVRSDVTVNLTEVSSGKSWTFSGDQTYTPAGTGEYFNVNSGGYGIRNCIIFRPEGIQTYDGVYSVTIDGIKDLSGNPVDFCYYVNFLPAESYNAETTSGWCGWGLEWMQNNDETLHVLGVSELHCRLALATYLDGKMLDIEYITASELDSISMTLSCPKGALAKLFWLDETMAPTMTCWSKQF